MGTLTLFFVWGENLKHVNMLGFLVVMGGYLKKRCFIALFYRFSNGLIQTGFEHERLEG